MMKKIAFLFGFMFCLSIAAQDLNLNNSLPVNSKIKKGILPNGMTYYIYNTDVTKDVASYYIIQNVGSVLENDNQQGLAHFLEHMAFNGTEHFEGKGILDTLQKVGAVFGKDINAYTSFDETVYNMNNIPTTDELINTCLTVLHDWSNYLLLSDEEIDAERGVIKEEWRTRQSGRMRIFKQSLATRFNNTIYAERMPIGLMSIIDNFEYKALRDFYHDWYRTDLQAIAVVGDVDVDVIEKKIKDMFSTIPAVKNPIERFVVQIPNNKEMLYNLAMDDEVSTASISFGINHPKSLKDQTVSDLKESLLKSMVTMMLSSRLNEIRQKPDAPFLAARISYGALARSKNQFSANISPKEGMQQKAFETVLEEINRAVKFGFTKAEIDRVVKQYTNFYQTQIKKEADKPHGSIINTIKQDYLDNETMTDVTKEFVLAKQIMNATTVTDLHQTIKNLYTQENRILTVTGVKEKNNLTKELALKTITAVENNDNLKAYTDNFGNKTLMSNIKLKKGNIVSEELNKQTGATIFTLSNGVKAYYKFVDKNKDDVQFLASSKGGTSLLNDSDLPSSNLLPSLVQMSGLGDYSATDLPKILAGKTANTNVILSNLNEMITGNSVTKDVETLMQMIYLRFEKPRFDQDAFNVLQENITNYLARRSKDVNEKIRDSVTTTLYGVNNPKHPIFNLAMVKKVNFDNIKSIYDQRFDNVADFDFFFVGDVKKETIKPLLEKYIASIASTENRENWKNNDEPWVSTKIDKDIFLKMEDPKSTVRVGYKNDFKYSLKNAMLAETLGDILTLRYTETLREEEGGTYGASARASISKRPVEKASIQVNFDCNPNKVEHLVGIVHSEIEKIAKGDIKQLDIEKTLTSYIKDRKQRKDYNRYDMNVITNYVLEGYNMNDPKNFEDIINNITAKDLQGFTKKLLKGANTYEIIFKPEMMN